MLTPFYAAVAFGYLLGSIPFGVVLSRAAGHGDIRAQGSGNIGATNVLRTGSKPLALAVLILDAGKGALAAGAAGWAGSADMAILAGAAALTGHLFPIWLRFGSAALARRGVAALAILAGAFVLMGIGTIDGIESLRWAGAAALIAMAFVAWGGKGVATGLGVLAAIAPAAGVLAALTWLAVAALSRRASAAALVAFAAAPFYAAWASDVAQVELAILVAALVFLRHRDNVRRLALGEEPRIGTGEPRQ